MFGTIPALPARAEKIHENPVKIIMTRLGFKPGVSGTQARSVIASSNMLGVWSRVSSLCNIYILESFRSPKAQTLSGVFCSQVLEIFISPSE
jgi:hypothetical protein